MHSIDFSPDGSTLAVGGEDRGFGKVVLLDVGVESWKKRTCRIARRNLTQAEWERYLGNEPYHQTCPNLPLS